MPAALASLAGIDDEPRQFHLRLAVVGPQFAVADKPLIAVQPELLHPVLTAPCPDLLSRPRLPRLRQPLVTHG